MADDTYPRTVWVDGTGKNFRVEIAIGPFKLAGDEGRNSGGDDTGPNPFDYLLTSLGTCSAMVIGFVARKANIPLEHVRVKLTRRSLSATDCEDCLQKEGTVEELTREIELSGPLSDEQRQTLIDAVTRCPVSQALTHEIKIRTRLSSGANA
jgi:uncharacterized OsmC-like protein